MRLWLVDTLADFQDRCGIRTARLAVFVRGMAHAVCGEMKWHGSAAQVHAGGVECSWPVGRSMGFEYIVGDLQFLPCNG